MITVKNGEARTITFTLGGGMTVANLGTPTVVVSQDRRTVALEIINAVGSVVQARISKSLSLLLVAGLDTHVQLSFNDGHGGVLVLPAEPITVEEQFNAISVDTTVAVDDPEEYLDVEIDEDDFDPNGNPYSEYVELVPPPANTSTVIVVEETIMEEAYSDDEDFDENESFDDVVEEGDDEDIIEDGFDIEEEE